MSAQHGHALGRFILEPVGGVLLPELALHVGDHPARDLAVEDLGLDAGDPREELGVTRSNRREVILDLQQARHVQIGGVRGAFQHLDQAFGRVVTRPETERTDRGVDRIGAGLDGLHQRDERDSGG